ncbi:hypothetical protein MWN41_09245 [Ornithobacterium rhinotracheale]|uniref:hypothetical protein n=1 Tax=Ornithobacterium rhinotracheale TaxID=28251 RepID=UPI001FF37E80|nr:hypothetical protein [Ornithobacterium rhinotracheale]MCK0203195.1 hypothetical protein [Ornithobacterium rhinotracheale]
MSNLDYQIDLNTRVFYDAKKYLKFREKNKENIKSSRIIPPKLGSNSLGGIEVRLKRGRTPYDSLYEKNIKK